jgi:hypothetical protein
MKRLFNDIRTLICLTTLLTAGFRVESQDSTKKNLIVNIAYHAINNEVISLSADTKTKLDGKFLPVKGVKLRLYLDKDTITSLICNLTTDAHGKASTSIPPSLKDQWNKESVHTFITIADQDAAFNPSRTETPVTIAHLNIDTSTGRIIRVSLVELKYGTWTPVKAVDIKVGIKRSGSDLAVSEKENYTTDSTGSINAEFKRDNIPGDIKGMLMLVAKVEDNDIYGNLRMEKQVPWGTALTLTNNFNDRSLWAARFKTPVWLLLMEYGIFITVWGVIIYLVVLLAKIRKPSSSI